MLRFEQRQCIVNEIFIIENYQLLVWRRNKVSVKSIRELFDTIKKNNLQVNSIYWPDMIPDSEQLIEIAQHIKNTPTITEVNLGSAPKKNLDLEAISALAESLFDNKSITKICLGDNGIGDDGLKVLSRFLAVNTSIVKIDLPRITLAGKGVRALEIKDLAEALIKNNNIKSINLQGNVFGYNAFIDLSRVIEQNSTIEDIDLQSHYLGGDIADGLKSLSDALGKNTTITKLDISPSIQGVIPTNWKKWHNKINDLLTRNKYLKEIASLKETLTMQTQTSEERGDVLSSVITRLDEIAKNSESPMVKDKANEILAHIYYNFIQITKESDLEENDLNKKIREFSIKSLNYFSNIQDDFLAKKIVYNWIFEDYSRTIKNEFPVTISAIVALARHNSELAWGLICEQRYKIKENALHQKKIENESQKMQAEIKELKETIKKYDNLKESSERSPEFRKNPKFRSMF